MFKLQLITSIAAAVGISGTAAVDDAAGAATAKIEAINFAIAAEDGVCATGGAARRAATCSNRAASGSSMGVNLQFLQGDQFFLMIGRIKSLRIENKTKANVVCRYRQRKGPLPYRQRLRRQGSRYFLPHLKKKK